MKLLEPMGINGMVIPNRVLVPARVTRLSGEDGLVNQHVIERDLRNDYHVKAFDGAGRASPPCNSLGVEMPLPLHAGGGSERGVAEHV